MNRRLIEEVLEDLDLLLEVWSSRSAESRRVFVYARDIVKGRVSRKLEKIIAGYGGYAYLYARDVLKGRFKLGEPSIIKLGLQERRGGEPPIYVEYINNVLCRYGTQRDVDEFEAALGAEEDRLDGIKYGFGESSQLREMALTGDPEKDAERVMRWYQNVASRSGHELPSAELDIILQDVAATEMLLFWTIRHSTQDITEAVFDRIEDINRKGEEGWTLLHWAAMRGHISVLRLLLAKGAEADIKDRFGRIPLHWVAGSDSVDALIMAGSEVDARDSSGKTPLLLAAVTGHLSVIDSLVSRGADINAKDKEGRTPVRWAKLVGNWYVYNQFIRHGAKEESMSSEKDMLSEVEQLLEAYYSQIFAATARALDIDEDDLEELAKDADPTGKYMVWILKQMRDKNIRLPEDTEQVRHVLERFDYYKGFGSGIEKDIGRYKMFQDLKDVIRELDRAGAISASEAEEGYISVP